MQSLAAAISGTGIKPVYSYGQIAAQLVDGFWNNLGATRHAFVVGADKAITVNLAGLNATYKSMAVDALATWSDIIGVKFIETTGAAEIRFQQAGSLSAYSGSSTSGGQIVSSYVNVSADWLAYCGTEYTLQTFIHEIGHALGLGHSGNYNGSATYGEDNLFLNDSWQTTVMSYFSQAENTSIDASFAFLLTPMLGDIAAIQQLYGNGATTRTGNSTYGFNSNAGQKFNFATMLSARSDYAFTLVDDGGIDTLDNSLSNYATRVDLTPGSTSDVLGLVGNMSIDFTSWIENYLGGNASDHVTGNSLANSLSGGAGNDHLDGGLGNDTLNGGTGIDTLIGGGGNDLFYVDRIEDVVVEIDASLATGGADQVYYGGVSGNYTLSENVENLTLTGVAALNGSGNGLANTITGNSAANILSGGDGNDVINGAAGNDTLIGGAGADRLSGGDGSDVYYVDSSLDVVIETNAAVGAGGNDRVLFSGLAGTFTLGANVEALILEGTAAIGGTGNALSNTLTGNSAANTLSGLGGSDVINGGFGNDVLWGGAGTDKFVFDSQLSAASNVDLIADYRVKDDVIYLENAIFTALSTVGYLAKASFVSNAAGLAMDAFDRIIYETDTGYLRYDSDGTGAEDSMVFAKLSPNLAMAASEFFII